MTLDGRTTLKRGRWTIIWRDLMKVRMCHSSLLPNKSIMANPTPKPLSKEPLMVSNMVCETPTSSSATGAYGLM